MNVEKHVTFAGWVKERSRLDELMADSALAAALYDKERDTFTYYADPTKLKDYLSAGLPILLTDVPHNAREIEEMKCGMIVSLDSKSISEAIIGLMSKEEVLNELRGNSVEYIKRFDWLRIFDHILKDQNNGK